MSGEEAVEARCCCCGGCHFSGWELGCLLEVFGGGFGYPQGRIWGDRVGCNMLDWAIYGPDDLERDEVIMIPYRLRVSFRFE